MSSARDNSHFLRFVLISPDVGHRPRLTFWLTFIQSDMLPLFFSGLLSYLVGMMRRTSGRDTCKKVNSHFLRYVFISPEVWRRPKFTFWLTFFLKVMLPLFFCGLLSYLVGMKRRIRRHVACQKYNSHCLLYLFISPEAEILCRP